MGYYDHNVPATLRREIVADCAGQYGLCLVTCNCKLLYCDGYRFRRFGEIDATQHFTDWQAVAESIRPCIHCGHSRNAHIDGGRCGWMGHRVFRIFGACKCRGFEAGNVWPPIALKPGESVEFIWRSE